MPDAAPPRDGILDAAKYLLMVLVVVGHAVEPMLDSRPVEAGYLLIYSFHMPLFVLLCGHLGRDPAVTPRRAGRLVAGILLPYLTFQTLYALLTAVLEQRAPVVAPLRPYWMLWFLVALALWRAVLPYLARLRHPLLVAVAASLLVGLTVQPAAATVYRAVGLLPFFVLGYLLPPGFHRRLRGRRCRAAALAAFAAAAPACWLLAGRDAVEWLYWRGPYAAAGASGATGPLVRTGLLVAGAALAVAFLAWVPDAPRLARWGRRSMYVLVLHGAPLVVAQHLHWHDAAGSWRGAAVVVALAALLATALSTAGVQRVLRPLVEPRAAWLLVPEPGVTRVPAHRGGRGASPRHVPWRGD